MPKPTSNQPIDPSIIQSAPVTEPDVDYDREESAKISEINAMLAAEVERLEAEINARNPTTVRAELMKPYASAVYRYMVGYTVFVGFIIIFAGFNWQQFELPVTVFSILEGSTAVAAIGMVHSVVRGLFPLRETK